MNTPPKIALQPPAADGSLTLEIRAPQGATVAIEATGDLTTGDLRASVSSHDSYLASLDQHSYLASED